MQILYLIAACKSSATPYSEFELAIVTDLLSLCSKI